LSIGDNFLPLFGTETEYGIAVEGKGAGDLVAEARAVVRAYVGKVACPWYYKGEDPRNDMRGFHVDKLNVDPEDAKLDAPDYKPLPVEEERADRVLVNGARFYNDHGHPEYSTPECASLLDLVVHDKAGERIVLAAARARTEQPGAGQVHIFKNNTDFHGSSYGTHENYLIPRETPFAQLLSGLLPFFATRIIYTGAGKLGIEPRGDAGLYQLSQRADFFTEEASVDTLHRRPLVNTRDEPHTDPRDWRRLHVICGDANMSEYATALKIGTTYLVTSLLEQGWQPWVRLKQPTEAIKTISRDQSYKWLVEAESGTIGAVDIQRVYLAAAKEKLSGRGADTDWTLREWERTLDGLESDPLSLGNRLDWVEGLYYALEQAGEMVRLTDDATVAAAMTQPPANTRAAIRGHLVDKLADSIGVLGWNRVVLRTEQESWMVDLDDYLTPEAVAQAMTDLQAADTLEDLIRRFRQRGK